ncbi:MAG: Y4yA family PLP-dependent enzyme [Gemmatimonadales bacterium]|nr:MAG: Y4yA family PLP-dependent enzyme [Gemmatimonadales bacterium]
MTRRPGLRAFCHGLPPLTARLEPWQESLLADSERLAGLVDAFGSPLNLHHVDPFQRNVEALAGVARARNVELEIFFARKASKALAYVECARRLGIGIDTASEAELTQALALGMRPERLVSTAAVKSVELVRTCVAGSVPVVVDNPDELERVDAVAAAMGRTAAIIFRLSGFRVDGEDLESRFGIHPDDVPALADRVRAPSPEGSGGGVCLEGLHFHLDGYLASHRIAGLRRSLSVAGELRARGHAIASIDMGGGFPMRYLDDPEEWRAFRTALDEALLGRRPPITHANAGLGRLAVGGRVVGELGLYPYYQDPVAPEWLAGILDADAGSGRGTLAEALGSMGLVLRCEPGRALLDGCGLTVARVEHRKEHRDGSWSIGVAMNRSQCATAKPDHAVDPILVPLLDPASGRPPPVEGFLMGAYCTESDLLSRRRLRFPLGVARGDLVVFPNTAGYLMHFVETRSHQFPLARNVVIRAGGTGTVTPDPIDDLAP